MTQALVTNIAVPGQTDPDGGGEEGGGATAFTDLTDAPEEITPNAVLSGNAAGDAVEFSFQKYAREGTTWADFNMDPPSTENVIDVSVAPYNGAANVEIGQSILAANPSGNLGSGIWVITAKDEQTDEATVARRADAVDGSPFWAGEHITSLNPVGLYRVSSLIVGVDDALVGEIGDPDFYLAWEKSIAFPELPGGTDDNTKNRVLTWDHRSAQPSFGVPSIQRYAYRVPIDFDGVVASLDDLGSGASYRIRGVTIYAPSSSVAGYTASVAVYYDGDTDQPYTEAMTISSLDSAETVDLVMLARAKGLIQTTPRIIITGAENEADGKTIDVMVEIELFSTSLIVNI